MRCLALALIAAMCIGCFNPNVKQDDKTEDKKQERKVNLANQFGVVADPDELGKRRGVPNGKQNPQQNPLPKFRQRRVAGSEGNVGVMTDFIVDYNAARKTHPHLKVLEKSTTGTVLGSAYFSAVSRLTMANFENQMRIKKELNGGRWLSYKDYVANLKQFRMELAELPDWQVYAYDDKTGKVFILEDPKLKLQFEGK